MSFIEKPRKKPRIAITHGDINGIGYEIILKLLADDEICKIFTPIVYGSAKIAAYYRKVLGLESEAWLRIESPEKASEAQPNLINCVPDEAIVEMGRPTSEAGIYALSALEEAMKDLLAGEVDALVTAPINKSTMPKESFPFAGHTAYLGYKCGLTDEKSPLMILMADRVKVALVTEHLPVSKIAPAITTELIIEKLKALHQSLLRDFGINGARIAITALNPHAGDHGLIGTEEKTIIEPAIKHCREELAIACFGPYPTDGLWGTSFVDRFDAILAMYHDQGLAPFKALYMERGVNYSAGLPIVRTSPDHGTGYDIVGRGIASEESLREAVYTALDIMRNRHEHDYATRNPLRKGYYAGSNDNEGLPPLPENTLNS